MCGRFNLIATKSQIIEHFSLQRLPDYQPDYNIPPGQKILSVVRLEDGSNKAVNLHWGFDTLYFFKIACFLLAA